eukprot:1237226-Prymnesium_polylepis.1
MTWPRAELPSETHEWQLALGSRSAVARIQLYLVLEYNGITTARRGQPHEPYQLIPRFIPRWRLVGGRAELLAHGYTSPNKATIHGNIRAKEEGWANLLVILTKPAARREYRWDTGTTGYSRTLVQIAGADRVRQPAGHAVMQPAVKAERPNPLPPRAHQRANLERPLWARGVDGQAEVLLLVRVRRERQTQQQPLDPAV